MRLGRREEKPSQEEKKIEREGKEGLMSVLQGEVFCRQPTLDCQMTELPIQASQKWSDKRADVLLRVLLSYKGCFFPCQFEQCTVCYNHHRGLQVSTQDHCLYEPY